jgi:hypothetical protein
MAYSIKTKKPKTTAWNVRIKGKTFDRVYYNADIKKEDVKRSLVEHDGYDPEITLHKRGSF